MVICVMGNEDTGYAETLGIDTLYQLALMPHGIFVIRLFWAGAGRPGLWSDTGLDDIFSITPPTVTTLDDDEHQRLIPFFFFLFIITFFFLEPW
jgi:hypothetical protein